MAHIRREPIHTRQIECVGYRRDDGLWDIEGHIVDTKTYDYDTKEHLVKAGEAMHHMILRLTLDENFMVQDVEASTLAAPFRICGECNDHYKRLIGLNVMTPGFNKTTRELFRGTEGCTHITDLLGPMATTAYQTIGTWLFEHRHGRRATDRRIADSCYGFRRDGEAVQEYFPELRDPEG